MLKLLRANFSRLWKTRAFWAAAAVSAMAGAGIPIKYFLDNRAEGSTLTPDTACFACAVLAPILLSVLIPLFLGSDYSDGTLRNKRVAGHTRGRIYLANLITCAAAGAMLCAAYLACYLALALPLLGGFDAPPEAVLGFAVLMGTVVNNGIVFVDYVNQLRRGGMGKHDALVAAGRTRMRPIMMTAITTIFAMLPMVFSDAVGASMQRGMAVVVVGGLLYATFMTLYVVPVMYDILYRRVSREVDLGDETIDDDPGDAQAYLEDLRGAHALIDSQPAVAAAGAGAGSGEAAAGAAPSGLGAEGAGRFDTAAGSGKHRRKRKGRFGRK